MKAVKVMATIDERGQLRLDQPLSIDKDRRVEVIVLISEPDEGESKAAVLSDFRQAWHEAMTGHTIPVSQLWEDLEDV